MRLVAGRVLVQDVTRWLDTGTYSDAAFYIQTKLVVGTPSLLLETSPVPDDDAFRLMATVRLVSSTKTTALVKYGAATTTIARWVRWKLSPGGNDEVTFRVWTTLTRTAR